MTDSILDLNYSHLSLKTKFVLKNQTTRVSQSSLQRLRIQIVENDWRILDEDEAYNTNDSRNQTKKKTRSQLYSLFILPRGRRRRMTMMMMMFLMSHKARDVIFNVYTVVAKSPYSYNDRRILKLLIKSEQMK
jgi:hypothetical protein